MINFGIGNTPLVPSARIAGRIKLNSRLFFKREDKNPTGSYKDRSIPGWIDYYLTRQSSKTSETYKSLTKKNLPNLHTSSRRSLPEGDEGGLKKNSKAKFVISSSGNAAISAAAYCILAKAPLTIFISKNIERKKYARLKKILSGKFKMGKWPFKSLAVNLYQYPFEKIKDKLIITRQNDIDPVFKKAASSIKIVQTQNPKKAAFQAAKDQGAINLRGSTDDQACVGYEAIAQELAEQTKGKISALFLPASSGTGAVGIYHGFKKLFKAKKVEKIPAFYICQTEQVHSLTSPLAPPSFIRRGETNLGKNVSKGGPTIAPAICDLIGHRRKKIAEIIKKTGGAGLVMSNQEIRNALYLANIKGQTRGVEGGLALAGVIKASEKKLKTGRNTVCLVTGE